MNEIILASQSPRRSELLKKLGVKFAVIPSQYEEKLDDSRDPEVVAMELALGKAMDVAREHPGAYVIGSDTIVAVNGRQMEKPKNIEDAREMLLALSGKRSTVSTGVVVINIEKGVEKVRVDTAIVYFFEDSQEISRLREEYLASGDWKDKAGAYGIQSGAGLLIEKVEGNYDTIVGLPTIQLAEILNELGIDANV